MHTQLDDRKKALLTFIVEAYINTVQPVASSHIAAHAGLSVSPATIRNDMAVLEHEGLIESPHTSAGRVPTAEGYKEYIKQKNLSDALVKTEAQELQEAYQHIQGDTRQRAKGLARVLAGLSQNAVIVGFSKDDVYYTGISYLLAQPEFAHANHAAAVGEVVDQLESKLASIFAETGTDVSVCIGDENPLSEFCSFVGFTYSGNTAQQLFGLLGPLRMPYLQNIERMQYARKLLVG